MPHGLVFFRRLESLSSHDSITGAVLDDEIRTLQLANPAARN